MVKVFAGLKRKQWILHEDLRCDRSEFFKKAFRGGFQETSEKEIYLKDGNTLAFGYLVDWIYGRELVGIREHDDEVTWDLVEGWCTPYCTFWQTKLGLDKVKSRALSQYKLPRIVAPYCQRDSIHLREYGRTF